MSAFFALPFRFRNCSECPFSALRVGCHSRPKAAFQSPNQFDVEIHDVSTMRELAEQFVDEGLYGEVPEAFQYYIDYGAIARDLAADFSEITIAGEHYVYACR